jgi:hypothetical protein
MARARTGLAIVFAVGAVALGAFLTLRFNQTVQTPMALATRIARISPPVFQALGTPLQFGRFPEAKVLPWQSRLNARIGIRVSGPLGSGMLNEWAQQNGGQWRICSLVFRSDTGTAGIVLVDNSQMHCEAM